MPMLHICQLLDYKRYLFCDVFFQISHGGEAGIYLSCDRIIASSWGTRQNPNELRQSVSERQTCGVTLNVSPQVDIVLEKKLCVGCTSSTWHLDRWGT